MVPIAGDTCSIYRGVKKGTKVKDWIKDLDKRIDALIRLQQKSAKLIANALKGFKNRKIKIGNQDILLSKDKMKHILERHHPKYWDGSTKNIQSFLDKNMSVDDVTNVVTQVLKKNSATLMKGNTKIPDTVVNGVTYVLKISKGKITQFYPK